MLSRLRINFFAHFTDGIMLSSFGPLIPFLSAQTGVNQADFNFIFGLRGIAYILAGVLQKSSLQKINANLRMQICLAFCGIFFILFHQYYESKLPLSLISFILNLSIGSVSILANICMIQAGKNNSKYNISFSYGIYGIGGMFGPIVISIMGINGLLIIGIWCLSLSLFYFTLPREEIDLKKSGQLNQNLNPQQQNPSKKQLNRKTEYLFCGLFLLYSSITLSFRSWLPSFAVMQKVTTKQSAALSLSLYSIFLTVFRFIFLKINLQIQTLLKFSSIGFTITIFVSIVSYQSFSFFIIYGNSMIMGILFANYCPYLYALPARFGIEMTSSNTSNTIIAYAFGEAVVSYLIGFLMDLFHPLFLFIIIFLFGIINIALLYKTIRQMGSIDHTIESDILKFKSRPLLFSGPIKLSKKLSGFAQSN